MKGDAGRSDAASTWIYGLGSAVGAAVINVGLLLMGKALEIPFLVPDPSDPEALVVVSPAMVVIATVAPLVLGTAGAALIGTRIRNGLLTFQILAGVLTAVSLVLPLSLEDVLATRTWLAVMHVLAGAALIAALQRAKG